MAPALFAPLCAEAVIDLTALKENYLLMTHAVGDIICVVKANAYGHGAVACSQALYSVGAKRFAVANLSEALALRRGLGDRSAEILILGYTHPNHAAILAENRIIQTVVSHSHAAELEASGEKIKVHASVDVGMNRIGYSVSSPDTALLISELLKSERLDLQGVFTHFPCADLPDDALTPRQFSDFSQLIGNFSGEKLLFHACNTAAALRYPEMRLNACRCGIALYGILPSPTVPDPGLKQVMTLRAPIIAVHVANKGETVGYGADFVCKRRSLIATAPIGYGDGLLRCYTKGCIPTVNGYPAPFAGRICMDMCMLDVTDTALHSRAPRVGDTVCFFSADAPGSVGRIAEAASTVSYEITTAISSRVKRIYI